MTWISDSRPASPHPARARALVLAAACLLVVSGCTGETGAAPSGSTPTTPAPVETSASPTPTGTPSQAEPSVEPSDEPVATRPPAPDPPEQPAAMDGTDALAAIAAAQHFLDAYNFALATGVTDTLVQMSSSECQNCATLQSSIAEIYSSGGWQAGGTIAYEGATVSENNPSPGFFIVQFATDEDEAREYEGGGREVRSLPASQALTQITVSRMDSQWRVVAISSGDR